MKFVDNFTTRSIMMQPGRVVLAVTIVGMLAIAVHGTKRGYVMTAPRIMQSGSEESVCFTFHGVDFDIHMNVTLQSGSGSTVTHHNFVKGKSECVTVKVPAKSTYRSQKRLLIQGHGKVNEEEVYRINDSVAVKFNSAKLITFIQTDKPVYKPGQTVKFRILSVTQNLKPRLQGETKVWIENPSGVRMLQWTDLDVSEFEGLISLEFPLSEEPVLGKWKIFVDIENEEKTQKFEVKEYVLPKYEVTVSPPSFILLNATEFKVDVCAKYTYGQPVQGQLMLKMCVVSHPAQYLYQSRNRPCISLPAPKSKLEVDGCRSLTVQTAPLKLDSKEYSLPYRGLTYHATVIEKHTGIAVNASEVSTSIDQTPLKIKFEQGPKYFKPGFVYHGKVVVTYPDGSPASDELITIKAENVKYKDKWAKNFTTDKHGVIRFRLPPLRFGAEEISMEANAPLYGKEDDHYFPYARYFMVMPSSSHYAKQWFSPSGHFLQIDPKNEVIQCGVKTSISAVYSTSGEETKMYYQVLSRGNIVKSGSFLHSSNQRHLVDDTHPEMLRKTNTEDADAGETDEPSNATLPDYMTSVSFDVSMVTEMSPTARVLVYYVVDSGEIIADSKEFIVEKCLPNKVEIEYSKPQGYPGSESTLELKAEPGSLCAVGSVDKSVHLMSRNNQLTLEKVFQRLEESEFLSHQDEYYDRYCADKQREYQDNRRPPPRPDFIRRLPGPPGTPSLQGSEPLRSLRNKRMIMPYMGSWSKFVDSSKAFKNMGVVTLTDLELNTRPCELESYHHRVYYSPVGVGIARGEGGVPGPQGPVFYPVPLVSEMDGNDQDQSAALQLRTYFPETWLWTLEKIGADGEKKIVKPLPHTITDWVTGAFCSHPRVGLGVAPPTTVRAFQPFFASFSLPYSVIRGERLPVIVTVFNYLSKCLSIKLTLEESDLYEISGSRTKTMCICEKSDSGTFHITTKKIGEIDLTVRAETVVDEDICESNAIVSDESGVRDAVTRKLRVKAEGKEEEYSVSSFVCPEDGAEHAENFTLSLPFDLVPDSARGTFTVMGDVMGSTLSGLEKLVQFPSGCGEQNMVRFAPIISVMQYLTKTRQLTPEFVTKAKSYLQAGYQRELTYRHNDGSYSAFGKNDEEGSIWLSAFVVKAFAQAQKFIYIDAADMLRSLDWFIDKQLENGCFPQIGSLHNKAMQGGLGKGGPFSAGLSAYILIAMLETGMDKTDRSIEEAVTCLRGQSSVTDPYTVALMTYALTMYNNSHATTVQYMNKLSSMAIKQDNVMHWERPQSDMVRRRPRRSHRQASSSDVEMSAYALMAYLHMGKTRSQTIADALPIVQWLTKQRNAYGGFSSTQDTVVALQALSEFAALVYAEQTDITVNAIGQKFEQSMTVTNQNKLVLQKSPILRLPNNISVVTKGSGCAFIQANVKYNLRDIVSRDVAYDLKVSVLRVRIGAGFCKKRKISIYTKYVGNDVASNMVLITVKMVSGWIPDKDSVKALKKDASLKLKRYEITKDEVNFYFEKLTRTPVSFQFEVFQYITLSNVKPAMVTVMDYYDTELKYSLPYSIRQTCGTKMEIPYETQDNPDGDFIGQVRVNYAPRGPKKVVAEESCPKCFENVTETFMDDFCDSEHAYKMYLRNAAIQLKTLSDLRPSRLKRLSLFVKYEMPSHCVCSPLSRRSGTKLIILVNGDTDLEPHSTKKKRAMLSLSDDVTIIPLTRAMQRDMVRAVRRGKCDDE